MAEQRPSTPRMRVRFPSPAFRRSSAAAATLSIMKTNERRLARELRTQGQSVKEIARRLGVPRGSVGRWVRDVPLTPDQRAGSDRADPAWPIDRRRAEG